MDIRQRTNIFLYYSFPCIEGGRATFNDRLQTYYPMLANKAEDDAIKQYGPAWRNDPSIENAEEIKKRIDIYRRAPFIREQFTKLAKGAPLTEIGKLALRKALHLVEYEMAEYDRKAKALFDQSDLSNEAFRWSLIAEGKSQDEVMSLDDNALNEMKNQCLAQSEHLADIMFELRGQKEGFRYILRELGISSPEQGKER